MALVHVRLGRSVAVALLSALVLSGMVLAVPGAGAGGGVGAAVDPAILSAPGHLAAVIVQTVGGDVGRVAAAVEHAGGRVTRNLPIIHGFSATVPKRSVTELSHVKGVRAITSDARVHMQATTSYSSVWEAVTQTTNVNKANDKGSGITVALVDTGVTAMSDLSGRIVQVATDPSGLTTAPCINMSGEADCTDNYGHGTFIAGLIAGSGAASGGKYVGAAPAAKIVSIKIAGRDGSTDVSNVLAAIQWVVSFKDTYGIRVLNLSLGTNSTQSYHIDPLDYAVEQAWASGIVVVVAASNLGPNPGTITKPADDPYVITVGAIDDRGTTGYSDDRVPNFSAHGPTAADGIAKPDVVAPGAHVVSLNAPGSAVAAQFPSNMPSPYRRGSGTSFSAAIVSGTVALMLSKNPTWTPDRVKYALMSTAKPDGETDVMAVGKGIINAYNATFKAPAGLANQGLTQSSGTGDLQASRGTLSVTAYTAVNTPVISGNETLELQVYDPVAYTTVSWNTSTWYTSQWTGANWQGANWQGANWQGANWQGANWQGTPDTTSTYGANWQGSAFYGAWDHS